MRSGAALVAVAALGSGLLALGGPTARADSTFEAVADARLGSKAQCNGS